MDLTLGAAAALKWIAMSGPLHRPYPPDRYRGTTGEVSARLRPDDTEPEIRYRSGGSCEYLATGDQTGTTFGLYRWTFGPDETGLGCPGRGSP
jgi:hypothetical protein